MLLGPRLALALPDCRAQRTDTQVLSLDTHMNFILKTNVSMKFTLREGVRKQIWEMQCPVDVMAEVVMIAVALFIHPAWPLGMSSEGVMIAVGCL